MTCRRLLLLAFLAPVTGLPAQAPDQPAVQRVLPGKAEEQTKVPSEFARFVHVGDGGHLDTAVVTYRNQDGAEVTLFGAVHIADHALYEELQRRFQACDALLYELVGPENYRPKPGERGNSWVSFLQSGLKNMLELDFQLDAVNYDQPNFVHADMTPQEFAAAQDKAGESIIGLMLRAMMQEMKRVRDGDNADPGMAELAKMDLVTAFRNNQGRHLLRMVFASQLQHVERVAAGFGEDGKGSVLVEGRNEKCLAVLQRELKAGKKKLGIYYGAAHLPSMEQRLVKDLGFTKVGQEWLLAWDCAKRPDKKASSITDRLEASKRSAQVKKATLDVRSIADAIRMYILLHDTRDLPTMEMLTKPDANGVVALETSPKDPWGTEYRIVAGEQLSEFQVVSAGPDRKFGTDDDISSKRNEGKQQSASAGDVEQDLRELKQISQRLKMLADQAVVGDGNQEQLARRQELLIVTMAWQARLGRGSYTLPTMAELAEPEKGAARVERVDPWGTEFKLVKTDEQGGFKVVSAGPDRKFDTADDLATNWPTRK